MLLTPAHQYPTGAVLSGARRGALLDWLRRREAIAIEDDYDAEFRYDRAPVGALQGWIPSASCTPARRARRSRRRCGWAGWWCRPGCWTRCSRSSGRWTSASPGSSSTPSPISVAGELDRHLRRMRARYRARRDALVEALTEALPEVRVHGIRAGQHVMIQLRDGDQGR